MDSKNKRRKGYRGWNGPSMDIGWAKGREDRGWNTAVAANGGEV